MVLELHVWGPAFGLPSIDPECIAAVAYASQALREGSWAVVAAHDVSLSPNKSFPALRNGPTWVGGFHAIVQYLQRHSALEHNPDEHLCERERADVTAFSSFLRTNALPLLDLNLYTSSANYHNATAPAFTALLPWHLNYTIPSARRDAARARTQHLGLSALDIDSVDDGPDSEDGFSAAKNNAGIHAEREPGSSRSSLLSFGRKKGLKNLLSQPEYASRFKLDALANDCLVPLASLLGDIEEKELLFNSTQPTTLDCLALGYLALMQYPELPSPWLADTVRTRFPRLAEYTAHMRALTIGSDDAKTADLMALNDLRGSPEIIAKGRKELGLQLPWSPPVLPSTTGTMSNVATSIAAKIPVLKRAVNPSTIIPPLGQAPYTPSETLLTTLSAFAVAVAAALAGAAYYVQHDPRHDDVVFRNESLRRTQASSLADLGEAGAALAALGNQMDLEASWHRQMEMERMERENMGQRPLVEARVDVDVERVGGEKRETNVP